jgi:hypothetical protein
MGGGTVTAGGKPERKPKCRPTKMQHVSKRNLRLVPSSNARGDVFSQRLAGNPYLRVRTVGVGPRLQGATVGDCYPRDGLAKGYAENPSAQVSR